MPNNTVEIRVPKVTVSDAQTDSALLQLSLSGAPAAKYSAHKSGGKSVENPTAAELINNMAEAQALMFLPPEQKDITINDGKEELIFYGYDTGPSHEISFGGVNNSRSLVHRCARLDYINTAIYVADNSLYAEAVDAMSDVSSPCQAIRVVLEKIISTWESAQQQTDTLAQEIRSKIHEANKTIIDEEWYPTLDASDVNIERFGELMSHYSTLDTLVKDITSVYLGNVAGFNAQIAQFETMFQMKFIPSHDGGTCGKFVSYSSMVSDAEDKTVLVRALVINPGPRKFLVPSAVALKGVPKQELYGEAKQKEANGLVAWPEVLPIAGQIYVAQLPSWLPGQILPDTIINTGVSLDPETLEEGYTTLNEAMSEQAELVKAIGKELARQVFNNISLQDSTATVTTVLDVTWTLGKRYTVVQDSEDSISLFSGFLYDIQHRVSSSPGREEAVTQLTFSHVEAAGFTLPNK